ncbi:uncharacterized protein N7496_001958 [Penicillium cataractarum]|uniref:Myb-like DNA-binding domain-containing protein n=1 Tax=Penicillium cataractarum TaxID=2100454 RepID=A0A9X0B7G3_9EURO|nr:uncharacterized protein N7496_001958 [Penicillium cataractarum]KAJ5390890.1 hypothetical protein N7496_001958 [Penicillium cataractarum]
MPPKIAKTTQGAEPGVDQENAFLAMCLRNIDPDSKKVDMGAVAEALGYGNVKSAGNRFSSLKKKYNLRVELSYARGDGPASPKGSPTKVQKPGAKRGRKPKAQPAEESKPKEDSENADDENTGDAEKTSENEA